MRPLSVETVVALVRFMYPKLTTQAKENLILMMDDMWHNRNRVTDPETLREREDASQAEATAEEAGRKIRYYMPVEGEGVAFPVQDHNGCASPRREGSITDSSLD